MTRIGISVSIFLLLSASAQGQRSSGPSKGTLVVDGGGATDIVKQRFISLAGGSKARIVVIPTGASSLRFDSENTVLNPDWPRERSEWAAYERYLKNWFGADHIIVLHTRDRAVANSDEFVRPLRNATGVFLTAGNAGRIAESYLGTRTEKELRALLDRDGAIFGCSAGSIIMGSFVVRGRPDKPLLMAQGHENGFGFLRNVAIDPHLTQGRREAELVNVTDAHPEILGIGIDEDAGLVARGNCFEVIGQGQVAIYDNQPHPSAWYYWLKAGDYFDLGTWQKSACQKSTTSMTPKSVR